MKRKSSITQITKYLIVPALLFSIPYSLFPHMALAVCPVCTVAIGAGLGLSRWLGIDDSISSIWIGGLLMSLSFWSASWLQKKEFKIIEKLSTSQKIYVSAILWYTLTLIPLWITGVIGHPLNTIFGIDKIIFGTAIGSVMFLVGVWADNKIRKIKGRQLFVYQKVVFPTIALVLTSLLIYYIEIYSY